MQSQSFASRYLSMKRDKMAHGWALAKRNKGCYLFLAPYAILFITFFILPVCTSISGSARRSSFPFFVTGIDSICIICVGIM